MGLEASRTVPRYCVTSESHDGLQAAGHSENECIRGLKRYTGPFHKLTTSSLALYRNFFGCENL